MTKREKIAIKTAIDFAKSPENYGVQTNNSVKENLVIVNTLTSFFNFDDNGEPTGFNKETVDTFCWLAERPKTAARGIL